VKRALQFVWLILLVVLISLGTCLVARNWIHRMAPTSRHAAHALIHTKLGVTREQDERLHPIEQRFRERRAALIAQLRVANRDLGQAILEDRAASVRAHATVERIHAVQGEIQKLTLAHIFEMESVLTSDQYDRLLKLTAQGLADLDSEE